MTAQKPGLFLLLLLAAALQGCLHDKAAEERRKWEVRPMRDNKLPYGTFLAWKSLKYYFPESKIDVLPPSFHYSNIDSSMSSVPGGPALMILQGLDFNVSGTEWQALKNFINEGNEVLIFCSSLDHKIEEELNCRKENARMEELPHFLTAGRKTNEQTISIAGSAHQYGYSGRSIKGYFSIEPDSSETEQDSNINYFSALPDTLGYADGRPDFIRYSLGNGHLLLHGAPLVLSNYFLLQNENENYLTGLWNTLPDHISRIYWNDYYKRKRESAGLGMLFRYPATRLALLLAIFSILLYIVFEGKRKQRIIPVIPPLRNDSVSFVETVGRLYYNKGNHVNLAGKMVQQFLEWVRTHYYLNTNLLNEEFIRQLTIKSGQPETTVRSLMEMIHEIRLGTAFTDDAYLYRLYNTIQSFYKSKRS